jgi:hypothetical protein
MLWSLALLALCVPPSLAQPIKDPAAVMPANVLVYGEVRQPGELVKEFVSLVENSMLSNVPESLFKMMEELKAPPPPRGFEELGGIGLLLSPEVVREAGRLQGAAAAITGLDEHGHPEFVFIGLPGESNLPRLAFRAALTLERVKPSEKVADVQLYRPFRREGEKTTEFGPAYAMMPNALIAGTPRIVKDVIERIKGKKEESLASLDGYREANKEAANRPGLFTFINVTEGLAFAGKLPNIDAGGKQILKMFAAIRAQSYALSLEKGTLRLREVILLDPKEKGFLDLLPTEPVRREMLHFTPNDAVAALAVSASHGVKRYEKLLELLDLIAKNSGGDKVPSEEIGKTMKALDLDIGKDIIGRMNSVAFAAGDPSKAPMREVEEKGPDFESTVHHPEFPLVLAIEATDEDAAAKLLDEVVPKVYGAIHRMKDVKPESKEVRGQKVQTLPINKHFSLNFGRAGRTIVLGPYAEPVAQALNNGTKKQGLLGEDKVAAELKEIEAPFALGVVKPLTLVKALLMTRLGVSGRAIKPKPEDRPKNQPQARRAVPEDEKPTTAQPEGKPEIPFQKEIDKLLEGEGLIVLSVTRQRDRIVEDVTWTRLKPAVSQLVDLGVKMWLMHRPVRGPGAAPAPRDEPAPPPKKDEESR